jgi:hypothetical protein
MQKKIRRVYVQDERLSHEAGELGLVAVIRGSAKRRRKTTPNKRGDAGMSKEAGGTI